MDSVKISKLIHINYIIKTNMHLVINDKNQEYNFKIHHSINYIFGLAMSEIGLVDKINMFMYF